MCRELEQLKKEREEENGQDLRVCSARSKMSRGSNNGGGASHMLNNTNNHHHHPLPIGSKIVSTASRRLGNHHSSNNYGGSGGGGGEMKSVISDPEERLGNSRGGVGGESSESTKQKSSNSSTNSGGTEERAPECLILNISPDLGERIMLSGERVLIEEVFPETGHAVMEGRTSLSSVAWHQDSKHVIRFPLNGYCKLNSIQAITRLLSIGYEVAASHGGGVDSQQFSEYLFIRRKSQDGS